MFIIYISQITTQKLEGKLEACDTSDESLVIKDEVDDDDNNNEEADPGAANTPFNQPKDVDVRTEVKQEVKEEDGLGDDHDDDNNVTPASEPISAQCGAEFKSYIALVKHHVEVHKKSSKICDFCGKTFDNQKSLSYSILNWISFQESCLLCRRLLFYSAVLCDHAYLRKVSILTVI